MWLIKIYGYVPIYCVSEYIIYAHKNILRTNLMIFNFEVLSPKHLNKLLYCTFFIGIWCSEGPVRRIPRYRLPSNFTLTRPGQQRYDSFYLPSNDGISISCSTKENLYFPSLSLSHTHRPSLLPFLHLPPS